MDIQRRADPPLKKERYLMLALGSLAQISNALHWACFLPIMDKVLESYPQATESNLIALSNVFFIVFIPFGPLSIWVQTKYGVKSSMVIGLGLQMIGAWMRVLLNSDFYMLIIGSCIIAAGQPFIVNTASIVSANWFPQDDRVVSTMVGVNAYLFGQSCGFLLPMAFLDRDAKGSPETR